MGIFLLLLLKYHLQGDSLVQAVLDTWADRDALTEALKNAPPADGTKRVLEMIEEIQT